MQYWRTAPFVQVTWLRFLPRNSFSLITCVGAYTMTNVPKQIQQQRGMPAGAQFQQSNPFFGLLPREFARRLKDTFTYNVQFNTLGATTTSTQTVSIQNDADFVWTQGSVVVTDSAGTTFTNVLNAPILALISDSAAGRNLSDSQTHVSNYFGTAQNPFVLSFPKIFRAGGQVSVQLQNLSGGALRVFIAMHGFKVFHMPAE